MQRRRSWKASGSVAAVLLFASVAHGQTVQVIYSNLAGFNNSVPGIGRVFNPGTLSSSAFDRPFLSPDGSRWIIGAIADDATDDKEVLIVGSGITGTGAAVVAEEDTNTPFDATIQWSSFRTRMGINNSGQYVFSADTTAATTVDDMIVRFDGTNQSPVVREGSPSPIAGQNYGSTNDSAHILNDGTVRHRSVLTPTTTRQIIATGGSVLGETDLTVPGNQLVGPNQSVDNFTADRFTSSADGTAHIWRGDLNGPTTTDDIIVVNGNVVVQEGANLPGGVLAGTNVGIISGDAGSQQMTPTGNHWLARFAMADGTGSTATDVVLMDGNLLARTDAPIFTGSALNWDDTNFTTTFFVNIANDNGDALVGGLVNSGDVNQDAFLVYFPNGGTPYVLLREGDAVDLNNNGINDDNAFLDIFGNDDMVLTNDGRLYFIASIQDGANTSIGNAFLVLQIAPIPEPGTVALGGLGLVGAVLGWKRSRRRAKKKVKAMAK